MFIPRNLRWLVYSYSVFRCLDSIQILLFHKVVFSNCHEFKVAIESSSLFGMNKWREDAFFHWKFCKLLTYERTYLPVFCFLCVLHVPFLRGKTSNEKQNRDEWTFLYENYLAMQRNRTVKRGTSRKVYMHFTEWIQLAAFTFKEYKLRMCEIENHIKHAKRKIYWTGVSYLGMQIFTCRKQISWKSVC